MDIPKRKRSRQMTAVFLGTAFISLAACKDERVDVSTFPDLASCQKAAGAEGATLSAADCEKSWQEAQANHEQTAPHYADKALCEEQHGGACEVRQDSNGGSIFMPLMMGYMMGNLLSSRAGSGLSSQPLYRTGNGRFATPTGAAFNSTTSAGKAAPGFFKAAPATAGAAPLTRAAVAQRGGFGASRTGFSSGRSGFGG